MKNNRLGCLTGSGFLAGGLTLLIIIVVSLTQGGVLFSPGALNAQAGLPLGGITSHAGSDGQCKVCHAPFWSADKMADRCAACHIDIAFQRNDPSSLHGVLLLRTPDLACRTCHPDHRGANASLTDMSKVNFPHERVGFSLQGHQRNADGLPFGCNDCHSVGYTQFDQTVCQTCHEQVSPVFISAHVLSFGSDCRACHDGIDTYGSDFDHNHYAFALIGKHAEAACSACHIEARSIADLQSVPQDCYSCHAKDDAHEGRYGTDCGACHTPNGWTPATFDHNLSAFKLDGKHADVPCESCHINHVFAGTPTDCFSCHAADDKHNGSFGTDCAACHTTAGWLPATVNHNLFAFKLDGKHVNVACESCHVNNVFQGTPSDCNSCHAKDDAHQGQFGRDCAACHTTAGWLPATFDHNLSAFKLTGKHANVACESCHVNHVFQGTPTDCYSCHAKNDEHNGSFGTGCGSCHTTSGWLPANFDHGIFPLTGGHAGLQCIRCHKVPGVCHADPAYHAGMFGTNCAQCHSTNNWLASYSGSHPNTCGGQCINHEGASCRDCHTTNLSSATCTKCHDSNNPGGGGGDD
jgi:hypothetical protein